MAWKRQVRARRVLSGLEGEGEERRQSGLGDSCSMKRAYFCMVYAGRGGRVLEEPS
jgi:hypothetical protein